MALLPAAYKRTNRPEQECAESLLLLSSFCPTPLTNAQLASDLFNKVVSGYPVDQDVVRKMYFQAPIVNLVHDSGLSFWDSLTEEELSYPNLTAVSAACPAGPFCWFLLFVNNYLRIAFETQINPFKLWRGMTDGLTSPSALARRLLGAVVPGGVVSVHPMVPLRVLHHMMEESDDKDTTPADGWMSLWTSRLGSVQIASSAGAGARILQPFVPLPSLLKFHKASGHHHTSGLLDLLGVLIAKERGPHKIHPGFCEHTGKVPTTHFTLYEQGVEMPFTYFHNV